MLRRHNGRNNGLIPYGRRDAERDLGCGSHQAVRYLTEAQERGFIVATRRSSFDWKSGAGSAQSTTWRLTMKPAKQGDPTNEWRLWAPAQKSNNGCQGSTTTGARVAPQTRNRVPERHPLPHEIGCRSDTTSKTKSSYQGGSPTTDVAARDPAARAAWFRSWLRSRCLTLAEAAAALGLPHRDTALVARGRHTLGKSDWRKLEALVAEQIQMH
jgi:hypothetical protein